MFRGSVYHFAARAHAEGIHSPSYFSVGVIQRIRGSADAGEVLVFIAVAHVIDDLHGVLHSHPDGDRLLLKTNAFIVKHLKGIAAECPTAR